MFISGLWDVQVQSVQTEKNTDIILILYHTLFCYEWFFFCLNGPWGFILRMYGSHFSQQLALLSYLFNMLL